MKITYVVPILIFSIFVLSIVAFFSYRVSYAYFTDSVVSSGYTFVTASDFSNAGEEGSGSVVINEVAWAGSSASAADVWIELRNMTDESIDISGWIVDGLGSGDSSFTIPDQKIIPVNGYFVIANYSSDNESSVLDINDDVVDNSISISNNAEQLILKNTLSEVIDVAGVGSGEWFAGSNEEPKASMERADPPGDGIDASNWSTATSAVNIDSEEAELATPKAQNSTQ